MVITVNNNSSGLRNKTLNPKLPVNKCFAIKQGRMEITKPKSYLAIIFALRCHFFNITVKEWGLTLAQSSSFRSSFPHLHHYTQEWHPMIHPLGAGKPEHHTHLPDVSSPTCPNGLNPPTRKASGVCSQDDAAVTTGKPLQNIWCICPWQHSAEQKDWNNKTSALSMLPNSRFSCNSD